MGVFGDSFKSAFFRSDAKALFTVSTLIYPKGVLLGLSGLCASQSSSSTPYSLVHVFIDIPVPLILEQEGICWYPVSGIL